MINRLAQIENEIKNNNVSRDAYEMWKDNSVTKRFLLEIERDLLETRADYSASGRDSIEKIALSCVQNAEHCETLEAVIDWMPDELSSDE